MSTTTQIRHRRPRTRCLCGKYPDGDRHRRQNQHLPTPSCAKEKDRNLVAYVENRVDTDVISKYDYTNDTVGRRIDVVTTGLAFTQDTFKPRSGNLTVTASHGYNDRSEVVAGEKYQGTDITDKTNPVADYDFGYAYDNIGNRQSSSSSGSSTSYIANQLNQYEQISTLTDPVHDADGNMTLMPSSSGDWTLTWNAENRLVAAEDVDTKLEFTYDYMGRRIQKDVYTGSTGSWTLASSQRYVYDGWNVIQILDVQNSNAIVKSFTWGLDLSQSLQGASLSAIAATATAGGVGGLLCVTEHNDLSAIAYYATADANGNISEYLDNTGSVVAHYEYSPFGRLVASTGAKADDFEHRFSTKFFDSETSLYYYGTRYYSPELGRWVNRDPIHEKGGVNVYVFAGNNAIGTIDFLGLRNLFLRKESRDGLRIFHYERGAVTYKCIDGKLVKVADTRYELKEEGIWRNWGAQLNSVDKILWGEELDLYDSIQATEKAKQEGTFYGEPTDWNEVGNRVSEQIPNPGFGASGTFMFQTLGLELSLKEGILGDSLKDGWDWSASSTSTAFGLGVDFTSDAGVNGMEGGIGWRHLGGGVEVAPDGSKVAFNLHFGIATSPSPPAYFSTPDWTDVDMSE
ncbi:MAG: RHS repeat-associated core domain-containing protein [Lentisphaeria bacterium]